MIDCDTWLLEFVQNNTITLGLVLGVLHSIFKDSKLIQYLHDKLKR